MASTVKHIVMFKMNNSSYGYIDPDRVHHRYGALWVRCSDDNEFGISSFHRIELPLDQSTINDVQRHFWLAAPQEINGLIPRLRFDIDVFMFDIRVGTKFSPDSYERQLFLEALKAARAFEQQQPKSSLIARIIERVRVKLAA